MSFFERAMASIGIGSAKVNTHLDNNSVRVGEELTGHISITGGNVEQQVDRVYLKLMTYYFREVNDSRVKENVEVGRFYVSETFILQPKEAKQIPFSVILPNETPVSLGRDAVWLETGLDIKMAIDPSDRDYIKVFPHPYVQRILDAVQHDLGFAIVQCENEHCTYYGHNLPFVQEFEFRPTTHFRGHLDELEMIFSVDDYRGVDIIMEIDRKARGLRGLIMEGMDMDESRIRVNIPACEFDKGSSYLADLLANVIQGYL